jgi:hypothetical protein
MGLRSRKVAVGIRLSMMTQKAKSSPGLRRKQKSAGQSHVQIFGTIAKPNIPVRLPEGRLIFLRHWDGSIDMKSTRQEERRLEVPRVFLDETMRCLREYVQGMKAE